MHSFEDISIAGFESECAEPFCMLTITPGDRIRRILGTSQAVHAQCITLRIPEDLYR